MNSLYLTTPIYYVNDLPHIGHIYTTLVADTVARYQRLCGRPVRFVTGTDEHGQKIERAARDAGVEPIALADRVVARYHQLWEQLGITHDDFIRTSERRHERRRRGGHPPHRGERRLLRRPPRRLVLLRLRDLLHREGAASRQPLPGARAPVEWQEEENVFFRLSRYQEPLLAWYRDNPRAVRPESRANEVISFVARAV